MTVPADKFKEHEKENNSIGLWSLILISPKVTDITAYELARAIHQ